MLDLYYPMMNSSNPILCPFFPGSVCTRRHARHTLPTLTFTLTFTLHLQIDGASSRSIKRHFFFYIFCFEIEIENLLYQDLRFREGDKKQK